ncbi:TonB-dependent receptor [Roseisolibacter agri]|uniref:TonB-dependent receptor n=1 Tax=Roseisolibacter agri TaxID=2014610 RepID=UPI0024E14172|nr:TonB-dependent receptor [Roseisolibacter agri]
MRGRVVDAAGAPVRHAEVVVRQERTGAERAAAVDAEGRYTLRPLAAGTYTLRVRAVGYQPVTHPLGALAAGETRELDVRLTSAATALTQQVVTATRSPVSIAAVPGAVTVVTRGQIEAQTKTAPRLGPMLAQLVPGLGAATENLSNFGQNIRGRAILVLVDGVPQSTSRNVSRDFINIDPAMVERVEVVRGATSVYGNGATGGVINIITRRGDGEAQGGALRFGTDLSTEASLSNLGGAGLGPRVAQRVSGRRGAWDFIASGALARTGALFDAEGDRVPPDPTGQGGFAETNNADLFGKAGYAFGAARAQRLELSANHFRSRQATDLASDFSINALPAYQQKSRTISGLELPNPQGTRNTMLNAEYTHARLGALFGSRVQAQAYARDYHTVFRPFDDRRYRTVAATATTPARREYAGGYVMQTYVNSAKAGGRLQVETPLVKRLAASALWGADYTGETTEQPVHLYDSTAFDASSGRVFEQAGGAPFVPPLDLRTLGLFAQLAVNPVDRVTLRGGVRHERASVSVDDFTALNGVAITGGTLRSRPVLFNAGAVVRVTEAVNAFANYSEGFSLADVGLVIRTPPAGFRLGDREADPQQVDQVEAGVRGSWRRVQASATAFRNTSELGTSVGANLQVVRAPERVRGVELTLDGQPVDRVSLGATYTRSEGEFWTRVGADSVWQPLNSFRIQPAKLTAHVEHQTLPRWRNRVQVLHSGARDRAYEAFLARPGVNPAVPAFGERRVASYTLVDLLSTADVGRGTLSVGVRNLLNRQYFPIVSQLMPVGNVSYSAAPGATLSVGYSVSY